MGLRVKHLDTDVVRSCIQMVLHTSANRFHVTPCDERVDETVAALPHEVVIGESEAAPVVGVVRQVEVSGDVPAGDRSGLVRVASNTTACSGRSQRSGPRVLRAFAVCSGVTRYG
jgi:hypothetical protein